MNTIKKYRIEIAVLLLAIGLGAGLQFLPDVHAQQGVPGTLVQSSPTHLDAAQNCATSATTAGVLTFTPPGGYSFYLSEIDFQNVASSSAVTAAAPTTVISANLTGAPTWSMASGTTAGTNTQSFSVNYPNGLKSTTPGTNTTITLPTFATNQVIRVNACGYFAP